MKKRDYKLSQEAAEDQLDLFFDYYEIDMEDIPEAQLTAIEMSIKRITKGIRLGDLEFKDDDGIKITQKLKNDATIVYGELTGRAKSTMGKKNDTDFHGRIYTLCGSLTGIGEAAILKLKGADLSRCECIGALFLQV